MQHQTLPQTGPAIRSPEVSGRWAGATAAEQAALLEQAHAEAIEMNAGKRETDPRLAAYNLIAAGIASGLPLPQQICLHTFGIIEVQVGEGDQAAADAWCAYLKMPKPSLGEVHKGTARDFRVYKSRVISHPDIPGWTVEVCAYCDAEDGVR